MPTFSLATLARANGKRRDITLRPIVTTQAQANELAAIHLEAVRIWQRALPRIMAAYDPAPLADALTIDTVPGLRQAIAEAEGEASRLVVTVAGSLRAWALRLERFHRSRWVGAVMTATAVDLSTVLTALPVAETIDLFVERNVALVRDVSDQARGRIADAVFRGYQQRQPARVVAKELTEATGLARKRAVRIASDQTVKLASALDTERMAEAGIEWFRWRHSGKAHPRERHKARNGKVYDMKTGKARDGNEMVPPDDRPGMAPFCGCRSQAYLPLMEEFGL